MDLMCKQNAMNYRNDFNYHFETMKGGIKCISIDRNINKTID